MLAVEDLHVSYRGAVRALQGISLRVTDRRVVALLGNNGAGKSTLLRAISGTLRLHHGTVGAGSITWDDQSLLGKDPAQVVHQGIVQVPEGRRIFSRLTVEENLRAGAIGSSDRRAREQARDRVMALFPILGKRRNQRAGYFSGGEQQMLAIGRALMTSPKLLLLDEPSLGLAPLIVEQISAVVKEINESGTSILLVEQNASAALAIADDAYVLDVGKMSLSGTARELATSDDVQRLYLGHAAGEDFSTMTDIGEPAGGKTLSRWRA
ncbi:MAG: ABC transporter ATP-binding protein [Sciscionella sp.]